MQVSVLVFLREAMSKKNPPRKNIFRHKKCINLKPTHNMVTFFLVCKFSQKKVWIMCKSFLITSRYAEIFSWAFSRAKIKFFSSCVQLKTRPRECWEGSEILTLNKREWCVYFLEEGRITQDGGGVFIQ